jgi:Flp pilus assembly protein TadD
MAKRRPGRSPSGAVSTSSLGKISFLFARAYACHHEGRIAEAINLYHQVLSLKADLPECHNNLGHALELLGKVREAVAAYGRAIALRPDYPEAHANCGSALLRLGRCDESETMFRRAIMLDPTRAAPYCALGNILMDTGRFDEAETLLRRAIAINPERDEFHNNLGLVLKQVGRLAEARQAAEEAVRLAPRKPLNLLNLGEVRQYTAADPYVTALEALAVDEVSLSADDRVYLHFALAKAYADVGRHEDEFRHLLVGNALKRSQILYDEAATLGRMQRITAAFTPELVRASQGSGEPSPVPIFIIGMPRAGTTLVEQILASHPQVFGADEMGLFERATAAVRNTLPGSPEFPELVSHLSGGHFRALGASYLAEIRRLAPTASRITDKMPSNFHFAGMIHLALPNAVIVHVVRNPIDTCVSNFSRLFSEPQNYSYDLAELGRYYRRYEALMAHWYEVLPPGRMLTVRYEDLVGDLHGVARRLVAHCGLPWDERCLDFHRNQRPVCTASAVQVRRPIYTTSVARWRPYKPFLAPLLAELSGRT